MQVSLTYLPDRGKYLTEANIFFERKPMLAVHFYGIMDTKALKL
jgi:hypothetical protein